MAGNILMGILLGITGLLDWRKKYVPLWMTALICVLAVILKIIMMQENILEDIAGGIFLGVLLLGISKVTGDSIGEGDAFILLGIGIYMGALEAVSVLLYGLLGCACAGVIFIVLKRKKWKDQLAFIPFLFAGYVVQAFLTGG